MEVPLNHPFQFQQDFPFYKSSRKLGMPKFNPIYGKPHMGTSSCQAVGTYQNRNSSHPAAKKGWPVRHQCHADGGHWASLCNPPRLEWFDFWKVLGCLRRRDAARKMLRSMLEVTLTKYMISINGIDMLMLQKNKHARGWAGFVKTE